MMNSKKTANTLGLYLHLPFCVRKCGYCDFCSFPGVSRTEMEQYTERLCRDLETGAEMAEDRIVDTVYLGGGTPTLMPAQLLVRILETVWKHYRVSDTAEISVECNPATGSRETFSALRASGVTRVSIGLQSADDGELSRLGRIHTYSDFLTTYDLCRRVGFDSLNVDLMFGIPGQTRKTFSRTLDRVMGLYPEHLSVYGLIVEEGTPFGELAGKGQLPLPDEETERQMYMYATETLSARGWSRYEISNFARRGKESRHNLKYWNCEEYLGFGIAAHSFFGGERFSNGRDLKAYLAGAEIEDSRTALSESDERDEYVMLRMRLAGGVEETAYFRRFGERFEKRYGKRLRQYLGSGLVLHENGRWFFTSDGFYVSNTILSSILEL